MRTVSSPYKATHATMPAVLALNCVASGMQELGTAASCIVNAAAALRHGFVYCAARCRATSLSFSLTLPVYRCVHVLSALRTVPFKSLPARFCFTRLLLAGVACAYACLFASLQDEGEGGGAAGLCCLCSEAGQKDIRRRGPAALQLSREGIGERGGGGGSSLTSRARGVCESIN